MGDHKLPTIQSRPIHCTTNWLTLAIFTNDENSGAEFISMGDCVRAVPTQKIKCKNPLLKHLLNEHFKISFCTKCFVLFSSNLNKDGSNFLFIKYKINIFNWLIFSKKYSKLWLSNSNKYLHFPFAKTYLLGVIVTVIINPVQSRWRLSHCTKTGWSLRFLKIQKLERTICEMRDCVRAIPFN